MNYTQHIYTVENPAAITSVILSDVDVPVEVLPSGDSGMRATYFTSDKVQYDIEVDGETLHIRKRIGFMIGLFMLRNAPEEVRLTVYLPEGYAGDLSVATVDGEIQVRDVTTSSLAVKTTDGDIFVGRSRIEGNVTCKTLDGDIALGGITASEAYVKTTDGDISLDRPLISGRLSCRATDGDITGTLAGRASDYTFTVRTGDGHSNVASGGRGKTLCEIKTADGDIALSFEDRD